MRRVIPWLSCAEPSHPGKIYVKCMSRVQAASTLVLSSPFLFLNLTLSLSPTRTLMCVLSKAPKQFYNIIFFINIYTTQICKINKTNSKIFRIYCITLNHIHLSSWQFSVTGWGFFKNTLWHLRIA